MVFPVWGFPCLCAVQFHTLHEKGKGGKKGMSLSIKHCVHSWEWWLVHLTWMAIGHPFNLVWVTSVIDSGEKRQAQCFMSVLMTRPGHWGLGVSRACSCLHLSFPGHWQLIVQRIIVLPVLSIRIGLMLKLDRVAFFELDIGLQCR